jgi:hypothetical protein
MFLPVEVARLVERERQRELERRLPWLVALREQRTARSHSDREVRSQASLRSSGPHPQPRTGPVR